MINILNENNYDKNRLYFTSSYIISLAFDNRLMYGGSMKKLKSIDWSTLLIILKSCLIGIVATLLGIVVLSLVLKFTDLPTKYVSFTNDLIKIISLFVVITIVSKKTDGKLLIKSILVGVIYSILTLVIFSALNGGVQINASIIYDLLFAVISSMIISIIINLLSRKTV